MPPVSSLAPLKAAIVPVTPLQQNCTLLWNSSTNAGAVFDPGGDVPRIMAAIADVGITIERIFLTHGHIDHASGATELSQELGVPIEGPHVSDKFLLDSLEADAPKWGIFTARNVNPDQWLDAGSIVSAGGHKFEVRHCPGHTPGSVVYINQENGIAIVGDVLFQGSVGRTDFPYGNHRALIQSITTQLLSLDDEVTFVPGHGPLSTIGRERASNPFLRGDA